MIYFIKTVHQRTRAVPLWSAESKNVICNVRLSNYANDTIGGNRQLHRLSADVLRTGVGGRLRAGGDCKAAKRQQGA